MPAKTADFYALIGVLRDASAEEIKRAYFEAAQRLHPDKNKAPGETELFLDIQQAYEVLSNPKRRAQYDATLPAQEPASSIIQHQILFSRGNLVKLSEPQLLYVLIEAAPREKDKIPAPPLNVALVLDRSTSMQGGNMDMVKAAASQVLRILRPEDIFSVVAFSDKAEVIIPASFQRVCIKMEASIQSMQTGGATEIYQGLEKGLGEVRRGLDPSRVNHIILLTDGHTYGDEAACLALASRAAAENIGISGMGIGADWNDIFLDALASRTGGNSAYIAQAKDIQTILAEKFKALSNIFADEVSLTYAPQEGIKLNYAFRIQPEGGPVSIESPLKLGPILQDVPLNTLLEFIIEPSALQGNAVTILNGIMKVSIAARPQSIPPIRIPITREIGTEAAPDPPPTKILSALSRLTLYRLQEKARSEVGNGNIDSATRHLKNLAAHLLAQGEQGLARTALLEADSLERTRAWGAERSKEIKYRTRALLLSGAKEKQT
jgi:Ca-activated chloride channel family protein